MSEAVQHVGVTRSGKAIQAPLFSSEPQSKLPAGCASYTLADCFDAYSVFEYLLSRELSHRAADTGTCDIYDRMSFGHRSKLGVSCYQAERLALGLATIFDVLEHGKGLADHIFKD